MNAPLLSPFTGSKSSPVIQGLSEDDDQTIQNEERRGLLTSVSSVESHTSQHSDVAIEVPQTVCDKI